MEFWETAKTVLEYAQDVIVIILGVIAWLMNRKLKQNNTLLSNTTTNSTESIKIDSIENKTADTATEVTMKSKTLETPVTIVKREMELTLTDEEVSQLKSVLDASGRASDIPEVYKAIASFLTVNK